MKLAAWGVASLAMAVLLPGCNRKLHDEDVLAVVAGEPIRTGDLVAEAEYRRSRGRPVPGKDALLDEMIEYRRQLAYAKSKGIDQDPEFVRSVNHLLVGTLKERELAPELDGLEVGEEELRAAYDQEREALTTPAARRLAIIKIAVPEHASDERRAECRERIRLARELVLSGAEGFVQAAARFSDDQGSRYRGGDIGWIEEGGGHAGVPAEVLRRALELPEDGAVSEILEEASGFFLIRRTASREPKVPDFESVAPRLRSELLVSKRAEKGEAFRKAVAAAIEVNRYPDRLEAVEIGAEPKPDAGEPPRNP